MDKRLDELDEEKYKEVEKKMESFKQGEILTKEDLYRELEKGIKSLEEGRVFTEEEVYKELDSI